MGDLTELTADNISKGKKRKKEGLDVDGTQSLEIDITAPEPPSKKALRKAKRAKTVYSRNEDELGHSASKKTRMEIGPSKVTEEAPSRTPHGIWIGNLPFFTTRKDLQAFLTGDNDHPIASDQITRIHLPEGAPKPGSRFQNKGFAYVDFLSPEVFEKALKLSEKLLGGRRVLIKSSKDFQGRPQATSKSSKSTGPSTKRVFVGNLEFDINKEDLEHHFEICGPVHNVHMASFEDSGKCKGYAWIEFEQLSSAEAAMRGWLEIGGEPANDEKESALVNPASSTRTKKRVWVNRMGGRKLRMEFAEDKATRYKKRFGKEAPLTGIEGDDPDVSDRLAADDHGEGRRTVDDKLGRSKATLERRRKDNDTRHIRPGYPITSIQKLTGGIRDGEGTKIIFE
jgi:RNA recognition motif-containing protein